MFDGLLLSLPLAPAPFVASVCVVFAAGVVRGFAGFGFSALCVAGMTLFAPPARVLPPVFVLEVLASLTLLRGALRHADWPWLGWLVLGNVLCLPLGVALLAWLPETPLRLLIGALLLGAALALRSGFSLALPPTPAVRLATGLASGFANGVAAIGGIVVVVLMSTTQIAPAAMRATLIVMFLFTDLYALAWAALLPAADAQGGALLGVQTLHWAAWLAPAMLLGIALGQRSFAGVAPAQFRRRVLELLIVIALASVLRAAWALAG